jgi:hypothetical protein
MQIILRHVAHTRSGDKGNISNISVIAYHPELFPVLVEQLSEKKLKDHYGAIIKGEVRRYEVPGIWALNFVAQKALAGGVSRSLRLDPYGKSLSAALLSLVLVVPDNLTRYLENYPDPRDETKALLRSDLFKSSGQF